MNANLNLSEILSQVKKLNKLEQATLLKKIASMIQGKNESNKAVKISEISGLGAPLWGDVNIDAYVDGERQW
jgi:ribosomal protein L18E